MLQAKLAEKTIQTLRNDGAYEALLYVQSFVARKKRSLSPSESCSLAFKGIEILIQNDEIQYAGTLLNWLLSSGILADSFRIEIFHRIITLISTVPQQHSVLFVNTIFTQLSEFVESHNKISALDKRRYIYEVNQKCGEIFERARRWRDAKNSYLSIGDISGVARIVHLWASEGYETEYPIFFARVYLILLANKLIPQAAAFYRAATDDYLDAYEMTLNALPNTALKIASQYTYNVWEMCTMINELLHLAEIPAVSAKVDQAKVFTLILEKYSGLLQRFDPSLYDASVTVGSKVFLIPPKEENESSGNPMSALFKSLMQS
jgi:hypothetical protein